MSQNVNPYLDLNFHISSIKLFGRDENIALRTNRPLIWSSYQSEAETHQFTHKHKCRTTAVNSWLLYDFLHTLQYVHDYEIQNMLHVKPEVSTNRHGTVTTSLSTYSRCLSLPVFSLPCLSHFIFLTVPFLISCALHCSSWTVTQCNRILPPRDNKLLIIVVTADTRSYLTFSIWKFSPN